MQASHDLHVEEIEPRPIFLDGIHEDGQLLVCQHILLLIAELGRSNIVNRIPWNEPCLLCRLHDTVEDSMDATYAAAGQFLSQLIVELLDVRWLDLSDPLFSKAGADMVFDIAAGIRSVCWGEPLPPY